MSTTIWSGQFWKGAAERAVKTFAQSVLGTFGVLEGANLLTGDQADAALSLAVWQVALLVALVNAVLSLFTSIANPPFVAGTEQEPVTAYVPAVAPAPEAVAASGSEGRHVAAQTPGEAPSPVIHDA